MKLRLQLVVLVLTAVCAVPAQSQTEGETPLGDVARNIRKAKVTTKPAEVRVDNDNFSNIMENSESRRMRTMTPQVGLALGPASAGTPFTSADVNCSLSFSAHGIRLSESLGKKEKDGKGGEGSNGDNVPAGEIGKLEGPASIIGDSIQLSVYNGTGYHIDEITVGLTILRHGSQSASDSHQALPVPASSVQIVAKRSDTLVVYHFKGAAAPSTRATFTQPLGISIGSDQEWHWAIIEAKGTLAKTSNPGAIDAKAGSSGTN